MPTSKHTVLDLGSYVTIVITLILFVVAIFAKGLTRIIHERISNERGEVPTTWRLAPMTGALASVA